MTIHQFTLFADYFQFYVMDAEQHGDTSAVWTEEAHREMVAVGQGLLAVGPARNTGVPVAVEVRDAPPHDETERGTWDRVREARIDVPSGCLIVMGCTDYLPDAGRLLVAPGAYSVRIFYGGLGSVREDGLDGGDHYHVVLWPERAS